MAITKSLPRLKVWISIAGVPLEEYADEDAEHQPGSVTKYIEAVSGAEFSISYELSKPWPSASFLIDFHIDGKWVRGTFIMESDYVGSRYKRHCNGVNYLEGGEWFMRKFCFADLVVDDSDTRRVEDQLVKDLKQMSEITVKVFKVTNLRETDEGIKKKELSGVDVVPEKALKGRGLSHQASLKPPVTAPASRVWNYDHVDPTKKPFAIFTFKYRSKAALQSLLIVPRSPSPEPEVPLGDRDVDTLSPEEMRDLLRRQRERDGSARAVKREGRVKRERSRTVNDGVDDDELSFVSAKRARFPVTLDEDGVEIVDLT